MYFFKNQHTFINFVGPKKNKKKNKKKHSGDVLSHLTVTRIEYFGWEWVERPGGDLAKQLSSALFQGLMAALNYHMAGLDEETLRPHQCVYCGRRFKRKDHRIEHERIHTGERPYACRLCGRAFVQKHQLMSHVRRKHAATDPTIPRPYPPAPPPPAPPSHLGRGVGDQQSQY